MRATIFTRDFFAVSLANGLTAPQAMALRRSSSSLSAASASAHLPSITKAAKEVDPALREAEILATAWEAAKRSSLSFARIAAEQEAAGLVPHNVQEAQAKVAAKAAAKAAEAEVLPAMAEEESPPADAPRSRSPPQSSRKSGRKKSGQSDEQQQQPAKAKTRGKKALKKPKSTSNTKEGMVDDQAPAPASAPASVIDVASPPAASLPVVKAAASSEASAPAAAVPTATATVAAATPAVDAPVAAVAANASQDAMDAPPAVHDEAASRDACALLSRLSSSHDGDEAAVGAALAHLATALRAAAGGGALHGQVLASGAFERVLDHCIGHTDKGLERAALTLIEVASTEALAGADAAEAALALLQTGGRFMRLVRCLFAEEPETLVAALGACDAACNTYERACALRDGRVLKRLEKVAVSWRAEDEAMRKRILRFVRKVKLAIERGEKLAAIAAKWQARAASTVQNVVRQWITRRRRERLLREAQEAAASAVEAGGMRAGDQDESDESDEEDDYIDDFDDDD